MWALILVVLSLAVIAALSLPAYLLACGEQRMNREVGR